MWPFKKRAPKRKSQRNLGKATVTITARGSTEHWVLEFTGHTTTKCAGRDLPMFYTQTHSARAAVEEWRAEGSSGTLRVADNVYIPLTRIERIDVEYQRYVITEVD